jgi:succinoglycan biosynthesis protein ExoM
MTRSDLAIVICAFRREALLRRALASLAAARPVDGFTFSVVVVDNSDEGSAGATIASFRASSPFEIVGVAAHPANIAVARNAGVAAADTELVAFVDDDQTLEPGWFEGVALAARTLPHDVLFGPIEPEFEAPERATPATRRLFSRRLDAPIGRELVAMGPRKTPGLALSTGNTLFRRATTLVEPAPFDAAFGLGGGEDYDLFCRLQRRGRRFGWMPEAKAREWTPAARCEPGYLRRRFYAGGQAFAAAVAGASARPRATRWRLRARAAAQAAWLLAQAPVRLGRDRDARLDYAFEWAGALGKLSLGEIHPLYREG